MNTAMYHCRFFGIFSRVFLRGSVNPLIPQKNTIPKRNRVG
ncbi:hypothetical protein HMPREF9087_0256 [Enterococcus casseliflavus ATCC 12755]|uniref:Uncharacterized protein n=1 Tax=Enterococcus casseliflavus ATCC 12755 TaxID=888066 RepID=F0EGF9_ENTCA|nr:hypothetical protein HMPREF9087_0256 [Enterococcus casseliflavus ATCC 12755]